MSASLWGILAYAAGLIVLGAWIGRRVDAAGSFFVADRKLGPVLLFSTILAANLGAGTTVGAAGLAYRDGLSAWWWVGSAGIGTILLALWVGPRIWQVAARHGLLTMGDYLELRYGRSVRLLIAGLLWFATLTIVSGQLIAMAEIVSAVAGSPRWWAPSSAAPSSSSTSARAASWPRPGSTSCSSSSSWPASRSRSRGRSPTSAAGRRSRRSPSGRHRIT